MWLILLLNLTHIEEDSTEGLPPSDCPVGTLMTDVEGLRVLWAGPPQAGGPGVLREAG